MSLNFVTTKLLESALVKCAVHRIATLKNSDIEVYVYGVCICVCVCTHIWYVSMCIYMPAKVYHTVLRVQISMM